MKRARAALLPLLLAPAVALAFETVDTIPWPSQGIFPAYPREGAGPMELWAQGGIMRDDNVLRRETGEQADTIMRAGVGVRHEQRVIGRQRVRLQARADYYDYNEFAELDHLAYLAGADWLWEIGNDFSGVVGVGRERRLADIGESQNAVRNMLTDTRLSLSGGYRLGPSTRLRAALNTTRGESSAREFADTRATAVAVGADYVSPLNNTIGVEYRRAVGDAPVPELIAPLGTFVNNDYREREIALVVTYALREQLRSGLRLGRTERSYSELPGRDFDGTTGRATLEWLPGNKTSLLFSAYKEPRSLLEVAASHTVVKGVTFGPRWAYSAKTVLSALLLRERRTYEGDPALTLPGQPLRDELITGVRFGVGWEPVRHWQVALSYDMGERESNFPGRDYDFNAVALNVAWRY